MARKAPATVKSKRSLANETRVAGLTDAVDYLQQIGDPRGLQLDQEIAAAAQRPANDITATPFGGFQDVAGSINSE